MDSYQQTLDAALEVTRKPETQYNLPPSQWEQFRRLLKADPFLFSTWVAGFDKLLPRVHQPLSYLMAGRARHLAWYLTNTKHESEVIDQIRSELQRFGIDASDPTQLGRLQRALATVDIRLGRGLYKTSTGVPTMLCAITNDPNITMLIVHGVEPKAHAMCTQMGDIIASRMYRFFFPDRIPADFKNNVTKNWIRLEGRTAPHLQPCVEAMGANTTATGGHYDTFYIDDLNTEEQSPIEQEQACGFLNKIPGLSIRGNTVWGHVRRVHVGTRYGNDDDAAKLAANSRAIHINMPAEKRMQPTLAKIREIGEPTVPEILTKDDLADIIEEHIAQNGEVAYFRNYLLIPDSEAAALFPPEIIDANKLGGQWGWVNDPGNPHRRFGVVRAERDAKREIVVDPKTGKPKLVTIPLSAMRVVLGVDPSASDAGDEWAVSAIGRDHQGYFYQLETRAGHTHNYLLDVTLEMAAVWSPWKIGVEKAALSVLSIDLMQRDARFAPIKHRIVPVSTNNQNKLVRFRTILSPKLIAGDLMLSPDDVHTRAEAKQYKYGPKAKDNRLDSLTIALMCHGAHAASGMTDEQMKERDRRAERQFMATVDAAVGYPLDDWMEAVV